MLNLSVQFLLQSIVFLLYNCHQSFMLVYNSYIREWIVLDSGFVNLKLKD